METPNESVEQQQQPTLCVTGCGFFANCGSGGMCSKCFREAQQAEQLRVPETQKAAASLASSVAAAPPAASQPVPAASEAVPIVPDSPALAAASPSAAAAAAAAQQPAGAASPAEPKAATRCNQCRKKVGLTGFKCKCGLLFCGQHRYAEAHDCAYDYKTSQREKLAAANPVVQAAKVERI